MVLEYTPHLENRLKERRFPNDYPKKIFLKAEENYIDISQNSYIAIKKLRYAGKDQKIMIAYPIDKNSVKIITIHPEKDSEINNRIKNGRWIKYEQNKKAILR